MTFNGSKHVFEIDSLITETEFSLGSTAWIIMAATTVTSVILSKDNPGVSIY